MKRSDYKRKKRLEKEKERLNNFKLTLPLLLVVAKIILEIIKTL